MNQEYLPDWAIIFNNTADRLIQNIDLLLSKLK